MRENCEHQERVQEMKKYVRYSDGAKMYSMGKTKFQELAKEDALDLCTGITKNVIIPFDNQINKDTDLYRLYNTNIHEKIEQQKATG